MACASVGQAASPVIGKARNGASVILAVALLLPGILCAQVRLSSLFQDNAVLQAGTPLPVWGTATPAARLSVRFLDQSCPATADAAGYWRVDLAPVAAGQRGTLTVDGDGHTEARHVVAGEVWLCSGQSNMEAYLHGEPDWESLKHAPQPMARSFWAELREAQLLTAQADPHTFLAVMIDLATGTNISIHPLIKQTL